MDLINRVGYSRVEKIVKAKGIIRFGTLTRLLLMF